MKGEQVPRACDGRFFGVRVNVESVPRLPTFPARWTLDDPRRPPYFVFWTSEDGVVRYGLRMAPSDHGDAVLVTLENGEPHRIPILRRPLPRGTGTALLYVCPWCRKPRRYLYRLTLSGTGLVDYLGLRCQECAELRFASQGAYRGGFKRALAGSHRRSHDPLPRAPWNPRAVSDPWLIADQFPDQFQRASVGREH